MSYSSWSDNDLLSYYDRRRFARAAPKRSWKRYAKSSYIVLGCLTSFAIVCEALSHVSGELVLAFFVCIPAAPLAVYMLLEEKSSEQDFRALLSELQHRGLIT
ncbi:hypothetical protein B7760_01766 [Burkholderia glumae]|uniref:hypothetical protein n=1 Tax=Burkholderia glumae TaxID=337 RepID=UPI00157AB42A|nr:hypothetical protein [Burkholderia glumae]QKM47742.1 hypothetical protein B7760_01766 [Burkholderia glumae]